LVSSQLATLLIDRLLEYRRYMVCKPDTEKIKGVEKPSSIRIDVKQVHPVSIVMLYGLQLERSSVSKHLVGVKLRKPIRVGEFEEVLAWLFLDKIAVPIPSTLFSQFFECDLTENIVYEFWAPRIRGLERLVRSAVTLTIPADPYILSYKEMISSLKTLLEGSEEIRLYILSKFAQPGYLGRFIEEFGGDADIALYIAIEEPSLPPYFRRKLERYDNVFIVPTRSHRKIVLAVFKDEFGDWAVAGYRGSMNLFYPGVDDYMEAVNDVKDLQRLLHGLIRAFLVV